MVRKYLSAAIILTLVSACSGLTPKPQTPGGETHVEKNNFRRFQSPAPDNNRRIDGVSRLLTEAEEAQARHELTLAVAIMERAIRIQPENPLLWNRLAEYKLQQKDFGRAIQFARRSNSFSGSDMQMRESNQRIIELASMGD